CFFGGGFRSIWTCGGRYITLFAARLFWRFAAASAMPLTRLRSSVAEFIRITTEGISSRTSWPGICRSPHSPGSDIAHRPGLGLSKLLIRQACGQRVLAGSPVLIGDELRETVADLARVGRKTSRNTAGPLRLLEPACGLAGLIQLLAPLRVPAGR